ncbi:MAG: hypothetical protein VW274_08060 [Thalassolituus sp.]
MSERRSIFSIPLVRELSVVLIIKLALVFVIANLFFSAPVVIDHEGRGLQEHFGLQAPSSSDALSESEEIPHDQ